MVRRKINIKRIENATNRQVTFYKRRSGLMKKAHDLSVLCGAETAVIIFSSKGQLFQFASSSMQSILEKYIQSHKELCSANLLIDYKDDQEVKRLIKYIENLKLMQRHLMGEDLDFLSLKELMQLEEQINTGLGLIHAKKGELLIQEVQDMNEKVTEAQGVANENLDLLSTLIKEHTPKATCLEPYRHPNLQQYFLANPASPQLRLESCKESTENRFAKRSIMSEDLNQSPRWLE